jgi:DNA-binding NarL/FixJ family response regulator
MIGKRNKRLPTVRGTSAPYSRRYESDVEALHFSYIVADDHPSVAFAVGHILSEVLGIDTSRFATFTSSVDLLSACSESSMHPRLVVLDLVMPGEMKRVKLVQALLRADPTARVLVYTAEESAFLANAVIDAGATGFVVKTSPAEELMDAIAAIGHGCKHIDRRVDMGSIKTHRWASLTDCERAVLVSFCRGQKAADIVAETRRSYSTVTTHKYNGLNKLGLRDGADLLPYIYINGLLHELD